jgi:splicing factor 3B subunit 1
MATQELQKEEIEVKRAITKKLEDEHDGDGDKPKMVVPTIVEGRKKRRWDNAVGAETPVVVVKPTSEWDRESDAPTPNTSSSWDATPSADASKPRSRWDETPDTMSVGTSRSSGWDQTPGSGVTPGGKKRSRWDETPLPGNETPGATPAGKFAMGLMTPSYLGSMTPEMTQRLRWEAEVDERNRAMGDDELDAILPTTGYRILEAPASYVPIRTPQRKLMSTPAAMGSTPGFFIGQTPSRDSYAIPPTPSESAMPFIKPEDYQYFGKLLDDIDEEDLPAEEMKERKVMKLLLKIKSGTPPQRKTALRQIADKAREFGAESLFNQILPLLMSPTLEDQERHLLVKVIDRILYKLGRCRSI